jgi:hypothetical protein
VSDDETAADTENPPGREDDGQEYVDRSKIDFDPDDGLLSGTAIDGTSEIPGPHKAVDENAEDPSNDDATDDDSSDDNSASETE